MGFKVSWEFLAVNKYSPTAKKIANDSKKIAKETKNASAALIKKDTALRKTKASLLKNTRRLRDFRNQMKKSNSATSAMTGKLKAFAATAIAGLGIANLIQEGARVQSAFADLSSITGSTGKNLDSMKEQVRALSVATRILPADVATAFTQVASAKSELLETEGAVAEVTKQSLLLANAAGIEIPDAVRASVGALNQFNLGADQAGRFVNVIAAGAKVGASQVGETAEALKNAGSVASSFNVSFEETNALLQVLAKNGVKGAEAGTKLRGALLALETKTKGKLNPSVLGITESLKKLESANLDNAQMAKLFGAENITAGIILKDNIPLFEKWTKELTGSNVAQEQANIRLATFESQMKGAKVQLVNMASSIFDGTLPALTSLGGSVTGFLKSLDKSDIEAFSLILSGLTKVVQGLGLVFRGVFRVILTVVKPVLAIFKGIGEIIGQIAGVLATGSFAGFDISDSFDLGGKFLGLFGGDEQASVAGGGQTPTVTPSVSPSVVTSNSNATLNGEILVSAAKGSSVDSVQSNSSINGVSQPLNLGVGAAGG